MNTTQITSFSKALDILSALPHHQLTLEQMQRLLKIVLHEHYDCSIRRTHVLRKSAELDLNIPVQFKKAWLKATGDPDQEEKAAALFQDWIHGKANESLTAYLNILWEVV